MQFFTVRHKHWMIRLSFLVILLLSLSFRLAFNDVVDRRYWLFSVPIKLWRAISISTINCWHLLSLLILFFNLILWPYCLGLLLDLRFIYWSQASPIYPWKHRLNVSLQIKLHSLSLIPHLFCMDILQFLEFNLPLSHPLYTSLLERANVNDKPNLRTRNFHPYLF